MNTRPVIESPDKRVALSVSFNQDASNFIVGLDTGFCIFDADPCQLRVSRDMSGGIGIAEMLGRANFIGLVGGGKLPKYAQNKALIWDDSKEKIAIALPASSTTVRGLKISRNHIAVVLLNCVRVYKFANPPEQWAAFETANNPLGLCCLHDKIIVFAGRTPGQVQLVELETGNVNIIPAHGSALRAIDLSRDGEVLATASETGTLIRVFATSSCARIIELRRAVDPATIYSISMSPAGRMLAVTSDKSTLHIFDIPHPTKSPPLDSNSNKRFTSMGSSSKPMFGDVDTSQKWGFLGRIPLLPRVFSDVYSFASAHFEIGDEGVPGASSPGTYTNSGLQPQKGAIGWTTDSSLIVVGAGSDGRWEKFIIAEGEDGRRYCVRDGWKRYLGVI